jgi:AraC family transcriptional regulator of adaptative response/methylated-DNA-[protein]-cysteine methyltransferase
MKQKIMQRPVFHSSSLQINEMNIVDYKNIANQLTIHYGSMSSPFGNCFLAASNQGVCKLAFFDTDEERQRIVTELHDTWHGSKLQDNKSYIESNFVDIFNTRRELKSLSVLVKGTAFQLSVWRTLAMLATGKLASYQQIADEIKNPRAVRAVASAIAQNEVAYLIPCHRIIRKNGEIGEFEWGSQRKRAMIEWEMAYT